MESHAGEINFNGFGLFHELFVHNEFKAFNFKVIVTVFRLIQSHCKGGPASAAGVKKNPNGGGFFPLEIVIDLRFRSISQLNHLTLSLSYLYMSGVCLISIILTTPPRTVNVTPGF